MINSSRNQFWLKIRKEYVFDNFDALLSYLHNYVYSADKEKNLDYDATLECMLELAGEYSAVIRQTPYYKVPDFGRDTVTVVKLMLATLLASHKAGRTEASLVGSIGEMFMKLPVVLTDTDITSIFNIVADSIRGYRLMSIGYSWNDVRNIDTKLDVIAVKFSHTRFERPQRSGRAMYVENNGLLLLPPQGDAVVGVMNLSEYRRGQTAVQIELPGVLRVATMRSDYVRTNDFERMYDTGTQLLAKQRQMTPSPAVKQKDYGASDMFVVRVVSKFGKKIEVETVDPMYNKITGNLRTYVSRERPQCAGISEGQYLYACLSGEDVRETFELNEAVESYYRDYSAAFAGKTATAIYVRDYKNGMEMITADGIRVGIDKSKIAELGDIAARQLEDAKEDGMPVEIKFYLRPQDNDADNFHCYAEIVVNEDGELPLAESAPFTVADADKAFYEVFCEEAAAEAGDDMLRNDVVYRECESRQFVPLIAVLSRFISGNLLCKSRLEYITAVAMMCCICDRREEFEYACHQRQYLHALAAFARNESVEKITVPDCLAGNPRVEYHKKVTDLLDTYRKKDSRSPMAVVIGDDSSQTYDKISALVSASNSLIDIIDEREVNNIKLAIAHELCVDDEYVSILDDRTYYGTESIRLEFKSTVVYPPENRRRYASAVADPQTQRWAIIKSVCGFLNSRGGGDLLIGVNDAGYAVGIDNDIKALKSLGLIYGSDIDAFRTYLQNILDFAFKAADTREVNTNIARTCLEYLPEENAEGKTIMRIRVQPYRDAVVELVDDASRPDNVECSYVRRSGRTVTLTDELRREVQSYKA